MDYWSLVELSGYPVVWLDEMDLSEDVTYIVSPMNGEFEPFMEHYKDRVSKVMLWNLERPGDDGIQGYSNGNYRYIEAGLLDGVIVSDRQLARDTGFKYVPLGSHHKLGTPGDLAYRLDGYDLIHLCCYSVRRSYLFKTPEEPKDVISGLYVASNGWGYERHLSLINSRFMLNIHQDQYPYMEPLRFSLAAAYGLPILTEYCLDIYPYKTGWVHMSENVMDLLDSDWVREDDIFSGHAYPAGLEMRRVMTTEFSFRACLEKYL
jgi:hypothetical protein